MKEVKTLTRFIALLFLLVGIVAWTVPGAIRADGGEDAAVLTALLFVRSSRRHPELELDTPNRQ